MGINRDMSVAAWATAGVPLLVTLAQTVLSLLDWTAGTIGVDGLLAPVFEVDVVFEAAVVFKQQPALVAFLFLLIAVAWGAQGAAMLWFRHRDAAIGVAGFAAVTYLVLFFGVYSDLFGRELATGQLVGFFSIPVVASALVVTAAATHDWSQDVIDRATGDLGAIEAAVEEAEKAFDARFDEEIGDLDALEPVAPSRVAEARSERAAFHERCDELAEEARQLEGTDDASRLRSAVPRLESRVEGLNPKEDVDRIATDLRQRVESGVRTDLDGIGARSAFGGSYTISNLPSEYREVDLPPEGGAVHVEDLADVIARRLRADDSLAAVGEALSVATEQCDRIESFLSEREAEVERRIDQIDSKIETVEGQIDRFPATVGSRVRDVLVENRVETVEGVAAIRRDVRDAKTALHECRFDDADRLLTEAEERSRRLVSLAEFLRSLDGRIDHGGSGVGIPDDVPEAAVEAVVPAFAQHYDTDVTVTGGRVDIGGASRSVREGDGDRAGGAELSGRSEASSDAAAAEAGGAADVRQEDGDGQDMKRVEEVLDSALYFLRELEEHARRSDNGRIQYQTDDLPPGVGTPSTLSNVERFLSHQSDLFDEVTLQSPEPPAFFEAVVADEADPETAVQTARERFIERYD